MSHIEKAPGLDRRLWFFDQWLIAALVVIYTVGWAVPLAAVVWLLPALIPPPFGSVLFVGFSLILGLASTLVHLERRQKKHLAALRREHDFALWLDRVDAYLRQYGSSRKLRPDAEWRSIYEDGIPSQDAAIDFL